MGLVSIGASLLRGAGSLFGLGGGAAVTRGGSAIATATGRGILSRLGGAAVGPFGQSVVGGGLGAALVGGFGGDGAVDGLTFGQQGAQLDTQMAGIMARLQAGGAQVTPLAGGRFLATAPNGDVQIFNRNGMAVRPSLIIPAGQRLPGGAVVVSTRQGGALIGITKRRRRRRFGAEIRTVRRTVQAAQSLVKLCKPTTRRS